MLRASSRPVRAILIVFLSLALPLSSLRAGMAEIVVGGTVLFQALQVISELVPQLATLAASVNALGSAGKELAQSGQRLLHMLFPNLKAGITKKSGKTPKNNDPVVVPTITGPKDAPAPTASAAPDPAAEDDDEDDIQLSVLVGAYRERGQPVAESHGSRAGPAASLTRGESWESLSDATAQKLLEAVRSGDRRRLAKFIVEVNDLPATDRAAVKPAVHRAVSKGAKFAKLHGEDAATVGEGFKALQKLDEKLR